MFTRQAPRKIGDISLFLIWIYFIYVETIDWHECGWKCEKITLKVVKNKDATLFLEKTDKRWSWQQKMSNCVILSVNKALFLLGNLN